jgi:hypothetical protein
VNERALVYKKDAKKTPATRRSKVLIHLITDENEVIQIVKQAIIP